MVVAVVLAALVALVAGAAVGYYVGHQAGVAAQPFATIRTIAVDVNYASGTPHVLGDGPLDGCAYANCPVELTWNLTSPLGWASDLSFVLLSTAVQSNLTANISAVSSSPSGVTLIDPIPLFLFANQTVVWGDAAISYPTTPATYAVTVTVNVGQVPAGAL